MIKGYTKFNEARRSGSKSKKNKSNNSSNLKVDKQIVNEERINMEFSQRLQHLLEKISKKGNAIAKELLSLPDKSEYKFDFSYLDLTKSEDLISYLPIINTNIDDSQNYTSSERQFVKVYKIIKNIFGSKYTKNEITKFVFLYKSSFLEGPDKKTINVKFEKTNQDILLQLAEDTIDDILEWKMGTKSVGMVIFNAKYKITEKKYLLFSLFLFYGTINEEKSFLNINLYDENSVKDKSKYVKTLAYKEIYQFLEIFKDKYEDELNVIMK